MKVRVYVSLKNGVLDPQGRAIQHSLEGLGFSGVRDVRAGRLIELTPTEFKLLHYLMKHAERVHSRSSLLDKVWGDHVFIEERTVDVHVKRLREALGAAGTMVETVRGAGYRLTAMAANNPVAAAQSSA
jgi:two-component system phosphate regulon response regulator PhoB